MRWIYALCAMLVISPLPALGADDPMAGLHDLLTAGCHEQAREELVKMVYRFHEQSNAPGEAVAWMLLGVSDASLGDDRSARFDLEEAESRFTALNDVFGAVLSILARAEIERQSGRLDRALAIQRRGLALIDRLADPQARFSVASLRVLAPVFGASPEQVGPIETFPDLAKPFFVRTMSILTRSNHAATLMKADDMERAERELATASGEAAMFPGMFDAELGYRTGQLRQRQWRLEEARESYLKALAGGPVIRMLDLKGPTQELSILEHLAELDLFSGRVEESLAWNDRALKLARDMGRPKLEAEELEQRADLLQKAGRHADAVALYEQLSEAAKASGDLWREASVESGLGQIYLFQSSYGTAARHLERAVELYQKLQQPSLEAAVWTSLAQVDMQVDLERGATEALDHARALASKSDFKFGSALVDVMSACMKVRKEKGAVSDLQHAVNAFLDLPDSKDVLWRGAIESLPAILQFGWGLPAALGLRVNLPTSFQALPLVFEGKTFSDRGEHERARAIWTKALETKPSNDLRAGIFTLIAASYWKEGNREAGIRNLQNAASALEAGISDVKVEEMLSGYLGGYRQIYFDILIDMLAHEGQWREAFAQSERARSRAFLQMVGNHRLDADREADRGLVREAEILRNEIAADQRRPTKAYDMARLRERYQTVLTRVKVSNPEYASLTGVEPLRLEEAQSDLPLDATLVSYFVSVNGVHVWVIDHDEAHGGALPIDRDQLRRIACWAQSLGAPAARGAALVGACDDRVTADEAFDLLIAPIRAWMRRPRLIVVPHGVLHYVPFAALHDHAANRHLIDDFTITYAPSASSLRFLRAKESPVDGGSLVLGDPTTALPRLPGAAQEAVFVARTMGTTAQLGDAAREDLLYGLHGKTDLVHLAAHGIYDAANPLFSRIALAAGGAHEGDLTVQDILSSVDLTGVNLVVLSACQTAVGARSGGDEVVGLTRALLYAGTPGVISTLWNIDDASSAGLMEEFYRRLRAGISVAEALRAAQLATREHHPDPRYWAAFTLNGDPQGRWTPAQP